MEIGALDLHLIGEGRHERLWRVLGAHVPSGDLPSGVGGSVSGVRFAVWAPAAQAVSVVGDWNGWAGGVDPMVRLGSSGVWERSIPAARPGHRYKYQVLGADGVSRLKADPVAFAAECPPDTASVVHRSTHRWSDGDRAWRERRARTDVLNERMAIYEVHLGSWRRSAGYREGNHGYLGYDELAQRLADYVTELGFTHVELLPPTEHPYDPSWGYQVGSYFAPSARFGDPDGFRAFVDHLHQRGLGVLVDWVPAHFPRDDWALSRFDGTPLYEPADPRRAAHPDWGTLVFDYGRPEVRNFLIAAARFWLEEMHVDGLRVDAVASMLYLDYSRGEGEWVANERGGREDLAAVGFVQELNTLVHRDYPGVVTVAEESTAWTGVTRPVDHGGLGFSQKWNMGWMHDTLGYFREDAVHRRWHHHKLTFGLTYAWSENFVLPLSHDEVVHGKGSLIGKMPGDRWQRAANLRALFGWMWAHPGKKLLFMGGELGQEREWSHDRELDWHLAEEGTGSSASEPDPLHRGVRDLVAELNRVAAGRPALWRLDNDPAGFLWIDPDDDVHSVLGFLRRAPGEDSVVCVANLTPVPRHGYRLGVPRAGRWVDVLNTDEARWGGSGLTQPEVRTDGIPWQEMPDSVVLTLPPLAVRWLVSGG